MNLTFKEELVPNLCAAFVRRHLSPLLLKNMSRAKWYILHSAKSNIIDLFIEKNVVSVTRPLPWV